MVETLRQHPVGGILKLHRRLLFFSVHLIFRPVRPISTSPLWHIWGRVSEIIRNFQAVKNLTFKKGFPLALASSLSLIKWTYPAGHDFRICIYGIIATWFLCMRLRTRGIYCSHIINTAGPNLIHKNRVAIISYVNMRKSCPAG